MKIRYLGNETLNLVKVHWMNLLKSHSMNT